MQPDGKLGPIKMIQTLVLFEPDDPDPNRRFKMFYEIDSYIRTGKDKICRRQLAGATCATLGYTAA